MRLTSLVAAKSSKEDSFVPPQDVAKAAAEGLELRKKFGRGGTSVGIARARDLSNRKGVSKDTLRRMLSFFSRHQENKDTPPEEGNGKIAWLLWGGDPGWRWAKKVMSGLEESPTSAAVDALLAGASIEEVISALSEKRDYKAEYERYHSKPEQIQRRSDRNKARRKMIKLGKASNGDGKDVDHVDRDPSNNAAKNLRMQHPSKNRGRNK